MTAIERARRYLQGMPVAVAGQGGHAAAFSAAVAAVRGFDLADDDALDVLREWNLACLPPWPEADLRHKVKSARRDGQRPFGFLLDADRPDRPPTAEERKQAEQRRQRAAEGAKRDAEAEAAKAAQQRAEWPAMRTPTPEEIATIAELRKLPERAVIGAAKLGWLKVGQVDGHACFILTEGTFAQARRLDGGKLSLAGAREAKAKNLPGSRGHFLGLQHLGGASVRVLLLEGCIGLLEGLALLELTDPAEGWAIVAATSASSSFEKSPDVLAALAGRKVTILADNDAGESGLAAAKKWRTALKGAGCTVRLIRPKPPHKDLGDLLASNPDRADLDAILA